MKGRSKYLVMAASLAVTNSDSAMVVATQAVAAESNYTSIAEKHCRKFDRLIFDGNQFAFKSAVRGSRRLQYIRS